MSDKIKYLFDSNIFIQASRLYYQFEFCQVFWNWIKTLNPNGMLSIMEVYNELTVGDDQLKDWIKPQKMSFVNFDAVSAQYLSIIEEILRKDNIEPSKIKEFLDQKRADAFLLAYAKAHNCVVVSHEVSISKIKIKSHKVQIPNVAKDLGVQVITIFDLMRCEENYFLGLNKKAS